MEDDLIILKVEYLRKRLLDNAQIAQPSLFYLLLLCKKWSRKTVSEIRCLYISEFSTLLCGNETLQRVKIPENKATSKMTIKDKDVGSNSNRSASTKTVKNV